MSNEIRYLNCFLHVNNACSINCSGQYTEQDEAVIKSRSIRKEDNLTYYKDRLEELKSSQFIDAIYAYSVRSKTNERNSIKLKETAMKLKKPIWIIQSVDVS